MVFFQAVLLAGYGYAHATTLWLGPRKQAAFHLAVLGLPLAFFLLNGPLVINAQLIMGREGSPIVALLLVLSLSVGVPMFVVCTSAPLLQRWFASTDHPAARDPYFLYGASNLGSMIALLGYPALVEPYFTLAGQRFDWAVGYGALTLLTAACAWLMWKSPRPKAPPKAEDQPTHEAVGWPRRMKWVALSLAPSSLMLGATTWITTDIAAIPLLWVLPLALYLLTFIIVFARLSPRASILLTLLGLDALAAAVLLWAWTALPDGAFSLWLLGAAALGVVGSNVFLLRLGGPAPMHRVVVAVMPMLVLLLVFVMLSGFRLDIVSGIALHLLTLFVVALACHGELARDRPAPTHLTEYFLWMSVGGVAGGLFNALFAPVAFNAVAEYQVMLVVACLLLPAVASHEEGGRAADFVLAAAFLAAGALLLVMRWRDQPPDLAPLRSGSGAWAVAALLLGGLLGGVLMRWGGGLGRRLDRLLDVGLPGALAVLTLGLCWGMPARGVSPHVAGLSSMLGVDTGLVLPVLTFGVPAVVCYHFVDRPIRFGLGVGAILLAAGVSSLTADKVLCQERSFFGVLRVKSGADAEDGFEYPFRVLEHGTTTHGKQFTGEGLRDVPLSYFHRTGPIGQVFRACNHDPARAVAVIGLGTGTISCYALKGQTLDFFDIDPVVVDVAFDTNEYFTFVEDAEDRGADVNLVLGDARLTFEPKGDKVRLKPLRRRKGGKAPQRRFGEPLTPGQWYGLIVVDAFSSDAIPVHLITREALEIYRERLLDDGVLCMHISNRYLDLQPVLANIVEALGLVGYHMSDEDDDPVGKLPSHWVVIARKKEHLGKVLSPLRWSVDGDPLALLGATLWPAPAGTALAAGAGMSHALLRVLAGKATPHVRSLGWRPLDTPAELRRRLALPTGEESREELLGKSDTSRRVGVWTDDYSNLLSVFGR
jgi:hypothetical protein